LGIVDKANKRLIYNKNIIYKNMGTETLDKQLISDTFQKLLQYVKPSDGGNKTNNDKRVKDLLDGKSDLLDGNGDKVGLLTLNMLDNSVDGLAFRSSNYANSDKDIFMISTIKRPDNPDPKKSGMLFWRPFGVSESGTTGTKMLLRNSGQLLLSSDYNFIDTFPTTNYKLAVQGGVYIDGSAEAADSLLDLLTCKLTNTSTGYPHNEPPFRVARNGDVIIRKSIVGPPNTSGLVLYDGVNPRRVQFAIGTGTALFVALPSSDLELKKNIKTFNENILEKFYKLNLKSFEWNDIKKDLDVKNSGLVLIDNDQKSIDAYESEKLRIMNSSNGEKIGLIAQEVEEIFPDVVKIGGDGYKNIDIERLLYYSIGCIKELTDRLNKLES